jgi:alcohol dehydrogenase
MLAVISSGRVDLVGLVTHRFKLEQIEEAYDLFANQRDGVLKVAVSI